VAEFSSTSPLYTVAFRFNPTLAFTALDVIQPGAATPAITRTLSHAVDAGSFKTTVLLTNTGTTSATYVLQFNDEQGNDPSPPVALDSGSSPLTGSIPPGGLATIRTAGAGPFLGWAQLIAPASVGGSVIYSQKNQLPSIQEGTATIVVTGAQHFFVPFDDTNGAVTAMALTNPGASAVTFTVTLRYSDGTSETPALPPLASRNHESFAIPDKFPGASNRGGVAEFVSSSPVNAVAFRFNPTLAFTAFGIVLQ
jgi:trimeric autotransporter adhesin